MSDIPCPMCGELIKEIAKKCRHCGEYLDDELAGERAGAAAAPQYDPALKALVPVGRTPLSIIAGYLGLFSLIPVFAPFALLVGILAIVEIKKDPTKSGLGRAIFGTAMGALFSILLSLMMIAIALG